MQILTSTFTTVSRNVLRVELHTNKMLPIGYFRSLFWKAMSWIPLYYLTSKGRKKKKKFLWIICCRRRSILVRRTHLSLQLLILRTDWEMPFSEIEASTALESRPRAGADLQIWYPNERMWTATACALYISQQRILTVFMCSDVNCTRNHGNCMQKLNANCTANLFFKKG